MDYCTFSLSDLFFRIDFMWYDILETSFFAKLSKDGLHVILKKIYCGMKSYITVLSENESIAYAADLYILYKTRHHRRAV